MEFMGNPLTNETQSKLAVCNIIDVMKDAIEEWGEIFKPTGNVSRAQIEGPPKPSDDSSEKSMVVLSPWLTKFEGRRVEDGCHDHGSQGKKLSTLGDFARDRGSMNCAWCTRPSALNKKCKRCGVTKYVCTVCRKLNTDAFLAGTVIRNASRRTGRSTRRPASKSLVQVARDILLQPKHDHERELMT